MKKRLEIAVKCTIKDFYKHAPLLKFIIENNSGYIFGGFLREIIYNTCTNIWIVLNRSEIWPNMLGFISNKLWIEIQ